MIRRRFLKRMALAAAACAFIDVPWPKREAEWEPIPGPVTVTARTVGDIPAARQLQDYLNWTLDIDAYREGIRTGIHPWPPENEVGFNVWERLIVQRRRR